MSKLVKIVDVLGKKVPATILKHPALLAAGVGVGLGAASAKRPVHQVENSIMREYLNAPGAKYSTDLEKFAARKMHLATKISFEKLAKDPLSFNQAYTEGMGKGMGSGIISEGIGAIRSLIGATAQGIKNKFFDNPKREHLVDDIVKQDPDVLTAEKNQPGQMHQAYQSMARFAPELSTDPNAVTSFLRNAAMSGGALDYNTIKGLAEAETAIQKARNEGAWLRRGF